MALKIPMILLCSIILAIFFNAQSADSNKQTLPPFSCDSTNPSTKSYPFRNIDLPIRERAHDLVSRLSLDEKISQLVNEASAVPRLGIPYYQWWSEALHAVGGSTPAQSGVSFNGTINAATSFPQVILTAATFDENLWYRMAKVPLATGRAWSRSEC
ncbi:hypothetical protein ABFX02_03G018000 [Erythranthe guttata]